MANGTRMSTRCDRDLRQQRRECVRDRPRPDPAHRADGAALMWNEILRERRGQLEQGGDSWGRLSLASCGEDWARQHAPVVGAGSDQLTTGDPVAIRSAETELSQAPRLVRWF